MPTDIPLRCSCGKLRGTALAVSKDAGTRIVCYCKDCQAFARFLEHPGVTDAGGGTDIFQMPPSRLRITQGSDALRCVRLSGKGMHRWFCGECKTPVGNTGSPRVPFVGLIHSILDHTRDERTRDEVLGKPLASIYTEAASGPLPSERGSSMLRVVPRIMRLLGTWWVTGAGSPSPFFDAKTRAPAAEPRILSAEERRALGP